MVPCVSHAHVPIDQAARFSRRLAQAAQLSRHLAQTGRLRHVWLADAPPLYPSVYTAHRVEQLLKKQILEVRRKRGFAEFVASPRGKTTLKVPRTVQKLLERTLPPPTVIGFTPRPTYFLPEQSPLRDAVQQDGVLSRLRLVFPTLPAKGLAMAEQSRSDKVAIATSPSDEESNDTVNATLTPPENAYDHVYETEVREPLDWRMPPFSGPGRLMLWTVADLQQPLGQNFRDPRWRESIYGSREAMPSPDDVQYLWAAILAQTTIYLLNDQFGIRAWADPTYSGLWVTRTKPNGDVDGPDRQIAAIWPHVDKESDIVTAGMTLNVASPKEYQVLTEEGEESSSGQAAAGSENDNNSKTAEHVDLDSDDTTSIAAELAAKAPGYNPKHRLRWADMVKLGKVMPVRQIGAISSKYSPGGPLWYTRAFEGRQEGTGADIEMCAPVGMDNYPISVAWSHELARVLGYPSPHVDHLHNDGWSTLDVSRESRPGSSSSWDGYDSDNARPSPRLPKRPYVCKSKKIKKGPHKEEHKFETTMSRLLRDLEVSVGGKRLDPRNEQGATRKEIAKDEAEHKMKQSTTTTSTSSSIPELGRQSSVY
ncbi:hypothetical protein PG999_008814 [Apiospora kogelbergensis]|uniref:Uncharacterized protein n=2 Tax=Apiospora kogelbergensis TaxID=1337665 RepID=A0AAW0QHK6_9PEZI